MLVCVCECVCVCACVNEAYTPEVEAIDKSVAVSFREFFSVVDAPNICTFPVNRFVRNAPLKQRRDRTRLREGVE